MKKPTPPPKPKPNAMTVGKREKPMGVWDELFVFVSDDFEGHWPVGTSAVVIARDEVQARNLLQSELLTHGLGKRGTFTLRKISMESPKAFVLQDGDY